MTASQRITALDIAKGIGIIFVVWGHCYNVNCIPGMFFYSFHMPLFFLLSGLCFSPERHKDFVPFLTTRLRQLVVPAFYFATIIIAASYAIPRFEAYDLSRLLWEGLPDALWFLIVLFIVEIAFFGILKLLNRGVRGTNYDLLLRSRSAVCPLRPFFALQPLCGAQRFGVLCRRLCRATFHPPVAAI